jgi:hypothetical protein
MIEHVIAGASIVLPVVIVAATIQGGTRPPRPGSRYAALRAGAAVLAGLAVVGVTIWRKWPAARGARTPAPIETSDPARIVALENGLRIIEAGLREAPRDRWDPDYIVQQVGRDPQTLFEWVRNNTYWIPYRGVLRGPLGVLMDRLGSSADRAMLLAALLQRAGHRVRLARGEIPEELAESLVPELLLARPPEAGLAEEPDTSGDLGTTLLAQSNRSAELISHVTERVETQTNRLVTSLGDSNDDVDLRGFESAIAALRDHWWVEREVSGAWVDSDLLAGDGQPTAEFATVAARFEPDSIPSEFRHHIVLRVMAEHWSEGAALARPALEHTLYPSELIGKHVALRLWPGSTPMDSTQSAPQDALRAGALAQDSWTASLLVDNQSVARGVIGDTAGAAPPPAGPMGGIGNALGRALERGRSETAKSSLSAVWVEYQIRTPGEEPRVLRRSMFDLLGPAQRGSTPVPRVALSEAERLRRSLGLTMETELLFVACRLAPEFVLQLVSKNVLTHREQLLQVARGSAASSAQPVERVRVPLPTPLYALALSRFNWSRFKDDVFVDRPGILSRHVFLEPKDGRIVWRDATDIVANEVGVDPTSGHVFTVRIEQGVLDTIAEAVLHPAGSNAASAASLLERSGAWVQVRTNEDLHSRGASLPETVRQLLAADLHAGYIVVGALDFPRDSDMTSVAWWRIDPSTGHTLGIDSKGWGGAQAATEYAVTFADAFVAEWLFCEALNEYVSVVRDGANFGDVFLGPGARAAGDAEARHGNCVMQAIAAGFAATLPLLLLSVHARFVTSWLTRGPKYVPNWPRYIPKRLPKRPTLDDGFGGYPRNHSPFSPNSAPEPAAPTPPWRSGGDTPEAIRKRIDEAARSRQHTAQRLRQELEKLKKALPGTEAEKLAEARVHHARAAHGRAVGEERRAQEMIHANEAIQKARAAQQDALEKFKERYPGPGFDARDYESAEWQRVRAADRLTRIAESRWRRLATSSEAATGDDLLLSPGSGTQPLGSGAPPSGAGGTQRLGPGGTRPLPGNTELAPCPTQPCAVSPYAKSADGLGLVEESLAAGKKPR